MDILAILNLPTLEHKYLCIYLYLLPFFPINIFGSDGKASVYNVGDLGSIPGLGRFPGAGRGKPLQYSCLENSVDRGALWATVHGVAKSHAQLND